MPTDPNATPQTPPKAPEDGTPQYVTKDEHAKVAALADALGANLRKEREAAAKREAELSKRLEEISSRLEQFQAPVHPGQEAEKTDAARKFEIEQAKADKRIKELEAKTAAAEAKAAETEARQREQEERQALSSQLAAHGIEGAKQRAALALLYSEEKKVKRNDKGEICFAIMQSYGEELISLEEGIKAWVGTDDGKSFLPPRGVQGAGTVPGKPVPGHPHRMTKQEALMSLIPALRKAQNG
jgi:uncharacterized coiled-coil protein SlyX